MKQRMNAYTANPGAFKALFGFGTYLSKSSIEEHLLNLVYHRVSQINGCAYCLDMHSKDLRAHGESEQRIYLLDAWRESPFYTERERAALAWAEAVTNLHEGHVPDAVYEEARTKFSEAELVDLTIGVLAINNYNRINIAFRAEAGSYKPGIHAVLAN